MADDKKSTEDSKETKPDTTAGDNKGPLTMKEMRNLVGDLVKEILPTGGEKSTEDKSAEDNKAAPSFQPGSVRGEVEREIAKIKAREARDQKDAEVDARLAKLDKALEVVPVERRWVHKLMGWGEND